MSGKVPVGGLGTGVAPFIEQLAAPTATPGGGSASAVAGAMAAALGSMVAGMSRGKKAYAQFEPHLRQAIARLTQLREELKAAIDADAESYNQVMAAYKQAKTSPNGVALIESALKTATMIPLETAQKAREVASIVESLRPVTSPNMASDLTVALALSQAAVRGALSNVDINLISIKDAGFVAGVRSTVEGWDG
ncbi:MAG TPA: cyclodeaminase/cyclohydrolase family protein [Verrucomicrobiae bacterium]|nr:cyclodeaminase/cyclohydrolase family protein [Verrucomicrobiae bacterium]